MRRLAALLKQQAVSLRLCTCSRRLSPSCKNAPQSHCECECKNAAIGPAIVAAGGVEPLIALLVSSSVGAQEAAAGGLRNLGM